MYRSRAPALAALGFGLALAPSLLAQEKEAAAEDVNLDEESSSSESTMSDGDDSTEAGGGDSEDEGGGRPVEPEADRTSTSPVERKGETYRFVGVRYRVLLIPTFVMEMFGEGGDTVFVHNFGPEFAIRRDGFEYQFALTYAPYSMGDGPRSTNQVAFKDPNDPEEAWELVTSELKVVYLTADFVWSHEFSPQVSLFYGGGAGIGFVFGDLFRTQAYREDGVLKPCTGNGNPAVPVAGTTALYCADDPDHEPDQHYPGYTEPSWADGGSKPIIFPWIALQTGLRFKPHRNFAARVELGIGLGQFFFGVGADYGL